MARLGTTRSTTFFLGRTTAIESGLETWAPSGITIRGDELFVAGLRSERLLRMTLGPDLEIIHVSALLERTYGRLRDVVVGPDGALYVTTTNGDGGGATRAADDRILKVTPVTTRVVPP
jgi:glucose/arabinose dehydrogenase